MIYAGWVTVASVVNVASWIESINVTINSVVAIIVLVSLGIVLTLLLMTRNVRELVIASAWGIAAVGVEQSDLVAVSAWTIAVLLIIFSMVHAYFNRHDNFLRYITR